jgi:hypothetical protein
MPYIRQEKRHALLPVADGPTTSGELNFAITALCVIYECADGDERHYARLNEIVGALECAKLEFYRRMAAPFEDEAKARNGDVYPL